MTENRQLATVVKVLGLEEIKGADKIELAKVLGWEVVVQKDDFKIGDLAIYFSIDSILDVNNPHTKFLEGKRLKTKVIRKCTSQGLLGKINWLNDYTTDITEITEGLDLTDIMLVKKYIHPHEAYLYDENKNTNHIPNFIQKTSESRVQDNPQIISKMLNKEIVITLKNDGCSASYAFFNDVFYICGRNIFHTIKDSSNMHYFYIAEKYDIEKKMREYGQNISISGEIVGPKVNGNRLKLDELDYKVFNIWNIDQQYYTMYEYVEIVCKQLELKMVELIFKGRFSGLITEQFNSYEQLLKLAGELTYSKGISAEGLVIKTNYDKSHPRYSCKVISNKYIIEHDL